MKLSKFLVLFFFLIPSASFADECLRNGNPLTAYANEKLTISTISLPFTSSVYLPSTQNITPRLATFTIESNAIRVWPNAVAPTATDGLLVSAGSSVNVCGYNNIVNFRMIRQSADAIIQVVYYR